MIRLDVEFSDGDWNGVIDEIEYKEIIMNLAVGRPFMLKREHTEQWFFPNQIQYLVFTR